MCLPVRLIGEFVEQIRKICFQVQNHVSGQKVVIPFIFFDLFQSFSLSPRARARRELFENGTFVKFGKFQA